MKKILYPLLTLSAILAFHSGCESPGQVKPLTRTITATPVFNGTYIQSADADQKPKPIKRVAPVYPFEMRRKGISGYAKLCFIVDTTGKPTQIQATQASKNEFVGPAIDSISEWRFSPGLKNGEPVACLVEQVLHFNISNQ